MWKARQRCRGALRTALLVMILFALAVVCIAQTDNAPVPKPVGDKPLTADERSEMLKLIRSLQERVEKLEAAQNSTDKATLAPEPSASPAPVQTEPVQNTAVATPLK